MQPCLSVQESLREPFSAPVVIDLYQEPPNVKAVRLNQEHAYWLMIVFFTRLLILKEMPHHSKDLKHLQQCEREMKFNGSM